MFEEAKDTRTVDEIDGEVQLYDYKKYETPTGNQDEVDTEKEENEESMMEKV